MSATNPLSKKAPFHGQTKAFSLMAKPKILTSKTSSSSQQIQKQDKTQQKSEETKQLSNPKPANITSTNSIPSQPLPNVIQNEPPKSTRPPVQETKTMPSRNPSSLGIGDEKKQQELREAFENLTERTEKLQQRAILLQMRERSLFINANEYNERMKNIVVPYQITELAGKFQNLLERAKTLYQNQELLLELDPEDKKELDTLSERISKLK